MGTLVAFERARGRGRQSAEVETMRDARDELAALIGEGRDLAAAVLVLARRAQVSLARGWSPANELDAIERLAVRHANRMAGAAAEAAPICPDGEKTRHSGHGAAA